jgi:phosphoribosylformylglycinamidine synthase subunit PurL
MPKKYVLDNTIPVKGQSDTKLKTMLKEHSLGLTVDEVKKIQKLLKRDPTLTELHIFNIQGSEHCSYKSTKKHLKMLPTEGKHIILPPSEDAGIVEIAYDKKTKKRFGIVMGHESHNHPSQVVPYEGAATGVGGIVRDILCMGAQVIATADPLRFGDIKRNQTQFIAEEVRSGIASYGNPIGVPNIAGDVYFDKGFNDNCLVNVVALGVLEEEEIIHSYAPKMANGYDIILVGKPTDNSGFGGAAFASAELKESDKEKNKASVQEPNPFLKRHLMSSTYELFEILKKKKMLKKVGFKDLGAGGIVCATVEMAEAGGFGAEIDLEKVHVGMKGLHPAVIACSETQERFIWFAHPKLTKLILNHYNKIWELPSIATGANASVIGKVKKGSEYLLKNGMTIVAQANAKDICEGLLLNRKVSIKKKKQAEPKLALPRDLGKTFLELLAHENIASRKPIYEEYDKDVQGMSVIEAGEADAGLITPLINRDDATEAQKHIGVALSVDGNPLYGQVDPYWEAVNAVVEGMRNVAAIGAMPISITDCLNYGNPEKADQMAELIEGIRGIADALKGVGMLNNSGEPVPCISGNVSLYNFSPKGAIPPQAIIGTLGRMDHVSTAVTPNFKESGNYLFLIGPRKNELGGSAYYNLFNKLGQNIPQPNFENVRKELQLLLDLIDAELVQSCHDISDGGLAVAIAEMMLMGREHQDIGVKINVKHVGEKLKKKTKTLRIDQKLFSETGGFVIEVRERDRKKAKQLAAIYGLPLVQFGRTLRSKKMVIFDDDKEIISLPLSKVRKAWEGGLRSKLN